ncbi:MAG: HlyD family type I secretion periplasmic adaptor subunit [Pseudomonadota bacterium]
MTESNRAHMATFPGSFDPQSIDERAMAIKPKRAAQILLFAVVGFFLALVAWAALAELDEVTRGQGRVVPSGQLQVIQNLEGGIVAAILVEQGDEVRAGDVLVRLDNTQFNADFSQSREGYNALVARIARLEAETKLADLVIDPGLEKAAPEVVASERALHTARVAELEAALSVEDARLAQRSQSLDEARVTVTMAQENARLASSEVKMVKPLVAKGIEPQIELLRAEQRAATARGEAAISELAVSRANEGVKEAAQEIERIKRSFTAEALRQLTEARRELAGLVKELPALADRVERTEVRAPIDGVINQVLVNTLGGVVKPGEPLVEIVPKDDSLVVEARVNPADIAFLHLGQKARVKLTAYDYSVYGALEGRLEHISADAIEDPDTADRFYLIRVRTNESALKSTEGNLPIIPGMVAEVDVLNGKRSILDYILKPLADVQNRALSEN